MNDHGGRLTVLPALRARTLPDGRFVVTQKFLDGILAYVERWPGPVSVCMEATEDADSNLDHVTVIPDDLPFDLRLLEQTDEACREALRGSAVALVSLVDKHTGVVDLAQHLSVPIVYVAERSLRTRRQIIRSGGADTLRRWRRTRWTCRLERRYRRALARADGVQCNGTPTYDDYRRLNRSPLLYFDSRVAAGEIVDEATLKTRTDRLRGGGPLNLVFSGRLLDIKGVDHLPRVAGHLDALGVPFQMQICGGGDLETPLRETVARLGLSDCVHLRGVLDFRTELVPLVSREADLFVCCHRQGDPSCTYLETFACGTPIAGYDNEAFSGLVRVSGVGWRSPLDEPEALAAQIARLHAGRDQLAAAAHAAREFATRHTFERTMQARVDHLQACAGCLIMEQAA